MSNIMYTHKDKKGDVVFLGIVMVMFFAVLGTLVFGDVEAIIRAVQSPYAKWYFWASAVLSVVLIKMSTPLNSAKDLVGTGMVAIFLGWVGWPFLLWNVVSKKIRK